jgi:hypothetical protein
MPQTCHLKIGVVQSTAFDIDIDLACRSAAVVEETSILNARPM